MKIITKKEIIQILLFILTITVLIYFSKINFIATQNTIETFIKITLPSLFPFILFSQIIIKTKIPEILANKLSILTKIFKTSKNTTLIIILSYLTGFPTAANMINTLYNENKITKKDTKILISFTNNASPIFILTTIGIAMFNNIEIGIILLISHFLSSIIIGYIYSRIYNNIIHEKNLNLNTLSKKREKKTDICYQTFELLEKSINNTFKICLNMLGLMIVFNILSEIVLNILSYFNISNNIIKGTILGIFEIINGCKYLSTSNISVIYLILLISFLIGFSGLCIIFQIKSQLKNIDIKIKELIIFKITHGIISTLITYILLKFTNNFLTINVYSNIEDLFNNNYNLNTLYNYYLNIVSITIITISTILVINYNKKTFKKITKLY